MSEQDWADVLAAELLGRIWTTEAEDVEVVAAALRAEREACAKIAEARTKDAEHGTWQAQEGLIIAADIRARSNSKQ